MEERGFGLDESTTCDQKQTNREEGIQRCIKCIVHALQCTDVNCQYLNCQKMKKVVQHSKRCRRKPTDCPICKQLLAVCLHHAKKCQKRKCSLPCCINIKNRMQQAQASKRRITTMLNRQMSNAVLVNSPGNSNSSSQPSPSAQPHSSPHPPQPGIGMKPTTGPPVGALQAVQQVQIAAASWRQGRRQPLPFFMGDASTQTEAEVKEARDDKQSLEEQGIENKVLEDMGKLLDSGKRSDFTVQVQESEFKVHSSILCARSPVLSAMLEHDMAEKASNRIKINDCDADVFKEYLRYLYTGSVRSLTQRTVFGLYRLADQYLADDLKLRCLEHVRGMLCVQTFCDTVKLALAHRESDLLRLAVDFAAQNIQSILRSVEWQNFICEYPREANEILIKSVCPQS